MAKNRHPRKSAGRWSRIAEAIEPSRVFSLMAAVQRAPRPRIRGYDRERQEPVRYGRCAERGCRLLTAYGRCRAHAAQQLLKAK